MNFLKLFFISLLLPTVCLGEECKSLLREKPSSHTLEGNEFTPLLSSREIQNTLKNMVQRAKSNILIETRSIKDSELTTELILALERGVYVEIYVSDPVKQRNSPQTKKESLANLEHLEKAGVVIHRFPVDRLNRLTKHLGAEHHRKTLIIDHTEAYIGGANLRFDDSFETGLHIKGDFTHTLEHNRNVLLHRFNNVHLPTSRLAADPPAYEKFKLLGTRYTRESIAKEFHRLLDSAQRSITIAATDLTDPSIAQHLLQIKKQSPEIRINILLSSHPKMVTFNGILFQWDDHAYAYRKLRHQGIILHQYQGPNISHSKILIVDGETTLVGSYDLSTRSLYGNLESAVSVRSSELAEAFESRILEHFENGLKDKFFTRKQVFLSFTLDIGVRLLEYTKQYKNHVKARSKAYSNTVYRRIFIRKLRGLAFRALHRNQDDDQLFTSHNTSLKKALLKLTEEFIRDREGFVIQHLTSDFECTDCIYLYGGYRENIAKQISAGVPFLSEHGFFGRGLYISSHPRTAKDYSNIRIHNSNESNTNVVIFAVPVKKIFDTAKDSKIFKRFNGPNDPSFRAYLKQHGFDIILYRDIEGTGYHYYTALDSSKVTPVSLIQSKK